jgi:hypothetical protein
VERSPFCLDSGKAFLPQTSKSLDKYGESEFDFEILVECQPEELTKKEQFFLDSLKACTEGFNHCPAAESVRGLKLSPEALAKRKGKKQSPESIAKRAAKLKGQSHEVTPEQRKRISKTLTGRKRDLSPELLEQMSERFRGNKLRVGITWSEETKEIVRQKALGRKMPPGHAEKMRQLVTGDRERAAKISAALKGRSLTEEHKQKLRDARQKWLSEHRKDDHE